MITFPFRSRSGRRELRAFSTLVDGPPGDLSATAAARELIGRRARFSARDCRVQGHTPEDHIDPGEVLREG